MINVTQRCLNRSCRSVDSPFLTTLLLILLVKKVFQFTAPSSPDRHRQALAIFKYTTVSDPSITKIPDRDLGAHLYEAIARFLDNLEVPRGLKAVG